MAAGNYRFGIDFLSDDFCVKSVRLGDRDLMTSELELKESQSIENLNVVLSTEVGRLTGQILVSKDKPARVQWYVLIPVNKQLQHGQRWTIRETGQNGELDTTAAPGEYYLAFPKKSDLRLSEEEQLKVLTERAEKVTLCAGETTTVKIVMNSL
jgi:hypothetical protein